MSVTFGRPALAALLRPLPAVCLFAIAALALVPSFLPSGPLGSCLEQLGVHEASRRYSPALHAQLAPRLRALGLALLLAAVLAWRFRRELLWLAGETTRRAFAELRGALRSLRTAPYEPAARAALLVIVALATGLRLAHLQQPMRYDEAYTHNTYASQSPAVILTTYDAPNNHLFHSLCAHAACRAFGNEPWAVRLPAFLAGILLVPATYLVARSLYDRATAVLSSCLTACSSILIEYATNARGYALLGLFSLLLIALSCHVLRRKTVLGWGLWALVGALGFWTIPVMLFPFGAVAAWLALSGLSSPETAAVYGRSFLRYLLTACGVVVLLTALFYLPIFVTRGAGALASNRFVAPLDWAQWCAKVPTSLGIVWTQWHRDVPAALSALLAVGFVLSLVRHRRLGRHALPLAGVMMLWCALVAVVQRVVPFERVWLFALPLYLMGASAGGVLLLRRCRGPLARNLLLGGATAAVAVLLATQVLTSHSVEASTDTGTLRDGDRLARALRAELRPGDRVLAACPSDGLLLYHFGRHGILRAYLVLGEQITGWTSQRLLVVVNKTHGQSLADFIECYRLKQRVDLASARVVLTYESADVIELLRVPGSMLP